MKKGLESKELWCRMQITKINEVQNELEIIVQFPKKSNITEYTQWFQCPILQMTTVITNAHSSSLASMALVFIIKYVQTYVES